MNSRTDQPPVVLGRAYPSALREAGKLDDVARVAVEDALVRLGDLRLERPGAVRGRLDDHKAGRGVALGVGWVLHVVEPPAGPVLAPRGVRHDAVASEVRAAALGGL